MVQNKEIDLKVPQRSQTPWLPELHNTVDVSHQENQNFKSDLIVEAKINIYLFQNDKGEPLSYL